MKNFLLSYFRDDFVRHNAVFFLGSLAVSVLNYAYYPIISRFLSIEAFGEIQAYFSFAAQCGLIASVFGMIILNIKANDTDDKLSEDTVGQLYTLSTLLTSVVALGLILLAPFIGTALHLPSFAGFVLVAATLLISVPRTFAKFHLQAQKMFMKVSITELLVSGGKIIFAFLFILAGTQVAGALAGLLVATVLGLVYVYPFTKDTIGLARFTRLRFTPLIWRELRYGTLILFATGFSTFLYTADIIVVRYFFDSQTAGLYAGIATVARIVVFATGSVAGVTIAHVKLKQTREENHAIMHKALLLVGLVSLGGLFIFFPFPVLVVHLLMGTRFLPLANLLPLLALLMAVVALANLFVMYFLALRRYILIPVAIVSSLSIVISTFFWHNTLNHIVTGFLAGIGLALVLMILLYIFEPSHALPSTE